MPFRERAKNLFKTKSRGNSLSKSSTNGSDRDRWPSNVYKPGEPMPRPKYRAPPQKEHRRSSKHSASPTHGGKKSFQSTYSPMGTRAPSRRTSFLSMGKRSRNSFSGRSTEAKSRTGSVSSATTEKSTYKAREGVGAKLGGTAEAEGDDDVANVGLSRVQSKDQATLSPPRTADDKTNGAPNGLHKIESTAHDHTPFSEKDIHLALQRSHLEVPAH